MTLNEIKNLKSSDLAITMAIHCQKFPEMSKELGECIQTLAELKEEQKKYETLFNKILEKDAIIKVDLFLNKYFEFMRKEGKLFVDFALTSDSHHKKRAKLLDELRNSMFSTFSEEDLRNFDNYEANLKELGVNPKQALRKKVKIDLKTSEFEEKYNEIYDLLNSIGKEVSKEIPFIHIEYLKHCKKD